MALKVLKAPETKQWALSEVSGGLNLEDLEYKILDNQSPDCLNVWFNHIGHSYGGARSVAFAHIQCTRRDRTHEA